MTTAKLFDSRNHTTTLDIIGHAGFNPGNDVVCAAISTVAYNLINVVSELVKDGKAEIGELTEISGHIWFVFQIYDVRLLKIVTNYATIGLKMIAEQYPEHLEVITS